jgi:hypothetical protein
MQLLLPMAAVASGHGTISDEKAEPSPMDRGRDRKTEGDGRQNADCTDCEGAGKVTGATKAKAFGNRFIRNTLFQSGGIFSQIHSWQRYPLNSR